MKRLFFLLALLPQAAFATFDLPAINEGVEVSYDPNDPSGTPLAITWQPQPNRVYYFEGTDDLATGQWRFYPTALAGYVYETSNPWFRCAVDTPKHFLRLRYTEEQVNFFSSSTAADFDHDGVRDVVEIQNHSTNPFTSLDANLNEIPDDWETAHPPSPDSPFDFATTFAEFRKDWAVGLNLRFGPKLFTYGLYRSDIRTLYLHGESQDGGLKVCYTDDTLGSVSQIQIYPRLPSGRSSLINEESEVLAQSPSSTYTWFDDAAHPELSGFVFSGTTVGEYSGRDLLRTLHVSLPSPTTGLPTGATVAMPYRRVNVALSGGGTEIRRIPDPLAITSLPLTHISPTSFPVVIRDVDSSWFPSFYPDFSNMPRLGLLLPGSVKSALDADGLPEATRNPSTPWNQDDRSDTFNSPATCRQWFRYPNPVTYVVPGVPASFKPPGLNTIYPFGHFSNGFYPHTNDASDPRFFTSEMHMTLNYTSNTKLYFASDDDCWVFINGVLVEELDLGGPHKVLDDTRMLSFSVIQQRLGLNSPEGACRIDIFHADRYFAPPELRFLSTDLMRPIYTYQVIADSMNTAPLTFSLPVAPYGMSISPITGKISWELYGLKDGNGLPVIIPTGNHPVTIRVNDNLGHIDEQTFNIIVGN
jgi:fibro-slime domain-containing protein